jgi:uncharacterized protein YbjT (DUF2867 family)
VGGDKTQTILLTGATGYVGGQLLPVLLARGERVRCLVRRPEALASKAPGAEVAAGDVRDRAAVRRAMAGVDTAYYLVHSMASKGSFEEQDREAACAFGGAARDAGVRRIVYLGGLGSGANLSPHLRSRHEVGEILARSGVPVIEFRASIIIGAGSLSFEIVRALVERLPVMIAPRWVSVPAQPIAISDVLAYLIGALELPAESRIFEIGGADQVSYGELMKEYARQRGLRRLVIPAPVLTPRLSSLWLGLVTPVFVEVGRKLIDSIRYPTVVKDQSALEAFAIRPRGYRDAIAEALGGRQGFFVDRRSIHVDAPPEQAFEPIRRIGGATGWYYGMWMWRVRGAVDEIAGGAGLRRGRRDPRDLSAGDHLDWWRVEEYEPGRRLRLAAEMKLPGRAWLEFVVAGDGGSTIVQTVTFDPRGLGGRAYWYATWPIHRRIFEGMLRAIAAEAVRSRLPDDTGLAA